MLLHEERGWIVCTGTPTQLSWNQDK